MNIINKMLGAVCIVLVSNLEALNCCYDRRDTKGSSKSFVTALTFHLAPRSSS